MTEMLLLLVGCIFMIGSFFVTEKLSPSELNHISQLSEGELKKIIDSNLKTTSVRIDEAIEGRIEIAADKIDRALEKETNEKIMAISEYSDTVIEDMNKTHNEIMFLYSMLNEKHSELSEMASDVHRLTADVRNLQETLQISYQENTVAEQVLPEELKNETIGAEDPGNADEVIPAMNEKDNHNIAILNLHKQGMGEIEIAKRLGLGIGEVRLVIGLYRGENA